LEKPQIQASAQDAVEYVLGKAGDTQVVLGPLVRDGHGRWYFMLATAGPENDCHLDQVFVSSDEPEADRTRVVRALVERRPFVIHDTDDELAMSRLCETLWPGERITSIRQAIESERVL
jgi:hypothetical protein